MLKELNKHQEQAMPLYVEKWLNIGLSTDRIDQDEAISAVKQVYKIAGLKEPENFYFTKSPIDAINLIKKLDGTKEKTEILNEMIYGCYDSSWLGFYDFLWKECDIEECQPLEGLINLANHSGWLNVYEDTVVFQERPISIKFDDQKRLHCEDGPAIEYEDGFSVYFWHGVSIPDEWITNPESLTAETALSWSNIEQRRCACEIVTWARVLNELNAKVIQQDDDPMIGTLLEVDIPDIGKEKFLRVLCGTGREFAIPVPPEMKTALQANAWTFNIDEDVLSQLEVRT